MIDGSLKTVIQSASNMKFRLPKFYIFNTRIYIKKSNMYNKLENKQ